MLPRAANILTVLSTLLASSCIAGSKPEPTRETLPAQPPPTRRQDVDDVYHGVRVVDPYRWMEAQSPELTAWFTAQNSFARRILAAIPGRDTLLQELHAANRAVEQVNVLRVVGDPPLIFAMR